MEGIVGSAGQQVATLAGMFIGMVWVRVGARPGSMHGKMPNNSRTELGSRISEDGIVEETRSRVGSYNRGSNIGEGWEVFTGGDAGGVNKVRCHANQVPPWLGIGQHISALPPETADDLGQHDKI